jgi:oligoribonuclease NrnB/cAMP/cGMP phosphodiesterase (DHH superfamily)
MSTPKITELDVCIYHDPCSDGFGSAWAVWTKFGDAVEYLPGNHATNKDDADYWLAKVRDKHVVCFDFSFSLALVTELNMVAKSFQIIDHHVSAQKALDHLDCCYFDMAKSGAVLAWESMWTNEAPVLLKYVQDRDLWKWELPESKAISNFINTFPRSFGGWQALSHILAESKGFDTAAQSGRAILKKMDMLSVEIADDGEEWNILGHTILAVNCNRLLCSDVCEKLGGMGNYPFVAGYTVSKGTVTWSLRSNHGTEDVGAFASGFPGGGGHKEAAGFTVSVDRVDFKNRTVV